MYVNACGYVYQLSLKGISHNKILDKAQSLCRVINKVISHRVPREVTKRTKNNIIVEFY